MAEGKPKADAGQAEVQKRADEETSQGFVGVEVDPTPNERYSQESSNWDTPESSPKEAGKVGSSKFAGSDAGKEAKS